MKRILFVPAVLLLAACKPPMTDGYRGDIQAGQHDVKEATKVYILKLAEDTKLPVTIVTDNDSELAYTCSTLGGVVRTVFSFEPAGAGTRVTCRMYQANGQIVPAQDTASDRASFLNNTIRQIEANLKKH